MSSVEWSRYVRDRLGVDLDPEEISRAVADQVADRYREKLPLLPGAVEAVKSLAAEWPLGLATSSNRHVIDLFLELAGLADAFQATVSSEEVGAGKPAPDVYLAAAEQARASTRRTASRSRTRRTASARRTPPGMAVIAVPNRTSRRSPTRSSWPTQTIDSLTELTPETVGVRCRPRR